MRLAAVLASALLAGGCAAGSETKRVEASGVSLLIPASWRVVDARSLLDSDWMRTVETENAAFGQRLRQLRHPSNPVKLLAFEPDGSGAVNLFVFPALGGETLATFAGRIVADVRAIPGSRDLRRRRIRVAGGAAEELRYVLPYARGEDVVALETLQVLFVRRGREYGVTYSAEGEGFARLEDVFRQSIASLWVR